MLTTAEYDHWLAIARRHTRRAEEAADLLHTALIAAMNAGRRDLADPSNASWFVGVIRNTALMTARGAARSRKRDTAHIAPEQADSCSPDELQAWLAAVAALPAGARSVAVLALSGLNRREIASVLRLTDTSLRQRLTSIRKSMERLDPAHRPADLPKLRSTVRTQLELGLLRRSLLEVLQHEGDLGTHDPDGHLIVITRKDSQNRMPRQP